CIHSIPPMLLVLFSALLGSGTSIDVCSRSIRREVKWYYDERWRMCFATRVDCVLRGGIAISSDTLYASEETCTLTHMKSRWISFSLRCPNDKRMVVYSRSNGDLVPYIFDSRQCRAGQGESDMCDSDEWCFSHSYFGWCCKRIPFEGEGPNAGVFRFTGYGGIYHHIEHAAATEMPPSEPINCNDDGPRGILEWYGSSSSSIGCFARRAVCTRPAFPRTNPEMTFPSHQDCIDHHYPNYSFTYHFNCGTGDSVVTDWETGSPLVFSPQLCQGQHDSDFCNVDEYCATSSRVASCCRIGGNGKSHARFVISGKSYIKMPSSLFWNPLRQRITN
ncbi:hypothetical protein PMAYCL1PPCAC_29841, partial [Pristionchus mayeri]